MTRPAPNVPPALLREAKHLVEREPGIEAIVLFGSRARGDAHRESDYDLAVVSAAPAREVRALCEPLARASGTIQIVPVEPEALRVYRNTCNRVERAVVVDGQPLAGTWHRPRHRQEARDMDHDAFAKRFGSFISHADAAIRDIARARQRRVTGTNHGAFNTFRAGEHVAKTTLALYGLTPRKIHGVNQLADQLRSARQGAKDQDERNALAERIDQLNGRSDELNQLDYEIKIFESTNATEQRLKLAVELAERCLDLYARKATAPARRPTSPPDAHARALGEIFEELHSSPASLYKQPSRAVLGDNTNAAIDALCTSAADGSRTEQRTAPAIAGADSGPTKRALALVDDAEVPERGPVPGDIAQRFAQHPDPFAAMLMGENGAVIFGLSTAEGQVTPLYTIRPGEEQAFESWMHQHEHLWGTPFESTDGSGGGVSSTVARYRDESLAAGGGIELEP